MATQGEIFQEPGEREGKQGDGHPDQEDDMERLTER